MIRTLLWILGIYFLNKFIFDFLVPLFRTTNQIQRQMKTMQEQMKANQGTAAKEPEKEKRSQAPEHEYIDFEEVK